jgi:hypothetical protein
VDIHGTSFLVFLHPIEGRRITSPETRNKIFLTFRHEQYPIMGRGNLAEYLIVVLFEIIFAVLAVQAVLIGDTTRFYFVFLAMIIAVLPVIFEKIMGISLPPGVKSLVPFALFLHMAGGILRWYWIYQPWYDKFAHVISALAIALLIFAFFLVLDSYGTRVSTMNVLLGIFIITLVLGGIWEIGEKSFDIMLKSSYNNGLNDTIGDFIGNLIGTIIAVLVASWYLHTIPPGQTMGYLVRKQT